ncbi:MAG TPA: hypothetical protein VFG69_19060 [Nannocystaceae bacterium]|nr:hypothetical protein [Nannocystaceae bacterium]
MLAITACDDERASDRGGADPFWLPTGEPDNTSAPTIEIDATGAMHAVYPAYAGGRAYYAVCDDGCTGTDDIEVVRFDTDGTVNDAMLALDDAGRPHVLLATSTDVYYASCDGDCSESDAWTTTMILSHGGEREVTGEAFALDADGRPRFLMHTYVAYLGIGQKAPETYWVGCDAQCSDAASWSAAKIADQIWQSTQLEFDAEGAAHIATVATVVGEYGVSNQDVGAYLRCAGDCTSADSWIGTSLAPAFSTSLDAITVKPAIALALTHAGAPRIVMLSQDENMERNISYFACDEGCEAVDAWGGVILSDGDDIGPGLDIALDADDRPRFVYTIDYNIALAHCEAERCETADARWQLEKVEAGGEMAADEIFLWENCDVGAWFLHGPSLALGPDGEPRVGYQARDISGGWDNPDPVHTADCVAGTDMTWSRVAQLPAL